MVRMYAHAPRSQTKLERATYRRGGHRLPIGPRRRAAGRFGRGDATHVDLYPKFLGWRWWSRRRCCEVDFWCRCYAWNEAGADTIFSNFDLWQFCLLDVPGVLPLCVVYRSLECRERKPISSSATKSLSSRSSICTNHSSSNKSNVRIRVVFNFSSWLSRSLPHISGFWRGWRLARRHTLLPEWVLCPRARRLLAGGVYYIRGQVGIQTNFTTFSRSFKLQSMRL